MILNNKDFKKINTENTSKNFNNLFCKNDYFRKNILKNNIKIGYHPQAIHTEMDLFIAKTFLNSFFSISKEKLKSNISLNRPQKAEKIEKYSQNSIMYDFIPISSAAQFCDNLRGIIQTDKRRKRSKYITCNSN